MSHASLILRQKLIDLLDNIENAEKSLDMERMSKIPGVKRLNVMRTDNFIEDSQCIHDTKKQKLDPSYDCEKLCQS
jgi:ribosomal protein S8